jgi:hypothetical protein
MTSPDSGPVPRFMVRWVRWAEGAREQCRVYPGKCQKIFTLFVPEAAYRDGGNASTYYVVLSCLPPAKALQRVEFALFAAPTSTPGVPSPYGGPATTSTHAHKKP